MELITLTPQEDVLRALEHLIDSKNDNDEKITPSDVISLWVERPFEELRHSRRLQSLLQAHLFPSLGEPNPDIIDEQEAARRLYAFTQEEEELTLRISELESARKTSSSTQDHNNFSNRIDVLRTRVNDLRMQRVKLHAPSCGRSRARVEEDQKIQRKLITGLEPT